VKTERADKNQTECHEIEPNDDIEQFHHFANLMVAIMTLFAIIITGRYAERFVVYP
jgi:hypothetical protein